MQLLNDDLTFIKADSGYTSEIQVEVYLNNEDQEYVFSRTINKKITVLDYSSTNSREILNTVSTDVPITSGTYNASITVLDKNSNDQASRKTSFEVQAERDSTEKFLMSDILFFENYQINDDGKITQFDPVLTNSFSSNEKYVYAYFATYSLQDEQPLQITYAVEDDQNIVVQQNQYLTKSFDNYVEHFIRLNRYNFNKNKYILKVVTKNEDSRLSKSALFTFYWKYSPNSIEDLNLAIRQLRYIAEEDSIEYYREAAYEAKKAFFKRFWERQDPNPDTKSNSLMREYYRRINYSTEHFSATGIEGWLTDRGRIYVKFGHPDDIERHPFEAETYPYVIWRYYSLRKNFLFIDRTGFGDYVLHPSYYYVEYE